MVTCKKDVSNLKDYLDEAFYYAMDTHDTAHYDGSTVIDFVSFRFRKKVFHFLPLVYPQLASSIGKALVKYDRVCVTYNPKRHARYMEELLGGLPSKVVDVRSIAEGIGCEQYIVRGAGG